MVSLEDTLRSVSGQPEPSKVILHHLFDQVPFGRHLRSIRSHTSRFTNIQTHQTLSTQPTPSSLHIYTPPLPTHLTNLSHGLSNLIIQAIHTKTLVLCTTSKHFATCCLLCAFVCLSIVFCIYSSWLYVFLPFVIHSCQLTIYILFLHSCTHNFVVH